MHHDHGPSAGAVSEGKVALRALPAQNSVTGARSSARRLLGAAQVAVTGLAALLAALLAGADLLPAIAVVAVWATAAAATPRVPDLGPAAIAHRAARTALLALGAVAVAVALTPLAESALIWALSSVCAGSCTLAAVRLLMAGRTRFPRVLVVGQGDPQALARVWRARPGLQLVGVVDTRPAGPAPASGEALADRVARLAVQHGADSVVALPTAVSSNETVSLRELSWALETTGVRLLVSTAIEGVDPHRVELSHVGGTVLAHVRPSRPSAAVRLAKAGLDRLGAAALLVLLAPVIAGLVVMVRLDSPGGAIFRQVRVGERGRLFTLYKLRTMSTDAEAVRDGLRDANEGSGPLFKVRLDPRVTRVGRLLRTTSLDELPQLVNVLRGEMSLVGPRPALPEEVASYSQRTRRRLAVRPGITGAWQVGGRSDLDWEQSVSLDLDYTDNISLRRDLAICLSTLRVVVSGRGAY